jgi:DNA polymerase I
MLLNRLHTVFGWTVRVGPDANQRSLRNFPCQANGAEMMRLACCLATERGVNVVAPVHDALMIEGPADAIEDIVARTQEAMAEASAVVLDGFRFRSDASIVRWPDRYMDGRGREFWVSVLAQMAD